MFSKPKTWCYYTLPDGELIRRPLPLWLVIYLDETGWQIDGSYRTRGEARKVALKYEEAKVIPGYCTNEPLHKYSEKYAELERNGATRLQQRRQR